MFRGIFLPDGCFDLEFFPAFQTPCADVDRPCREMLVVMTGRMFLTREVIKGKVFQTFR